MAKLTQNSMKKIFFIIIGISSLQAVFCQNIPNVQTPCITAAEGKAGNFIISYTIGEMPLIQSWKNNGLMITQGILQPVPFIADTLYECYSQTEVKIYPNPTPGIFSLQLSILKPGTIKTILFDATGKLLQTTEFVYNSFASKQFNISNLSNGIYYLQLFFTPTGTSKARKCVYTIQKN
jgi:Secretion system C-terminal sorting domain